MGDGRPSSEEYLYQRSACISRRLDTVFMLDQFGWPGEVHHLPLGGILPNSRDGRIAHETASPW